jgi:hypothetical protein
MTTPSRFICPRRQEVPITPPDHDDYWMATQTGQPICSYCGSLHPEKFLAFVEQGLELYATDKNYKVCIGPARQKFYFQHLSVAQQRHFVNLMNSRQVVFNEGLKFDPLPFFMHKATV